MGVRIKSLGGCSSMELVQRWLDIRHEGRRSLKIKQEGRKSIMNLIP
jgi:hypothetical protein